MKSLVLLFVFFLVALLGRAGPRPLAATDPAPVDDTSRVNVPAIRVSEDPVNAPLLFACPIASAITRRRIRVVVYARYSTEEQNPRSIDDQVDRCRRFIETLGLGDVESPWSSVASASPHLVPGGVEATERKGCPPAVPDPRPSTPAGGKDEYREPHPAYGGELLNTMDGLSNSR